MIILNYERALPYGREKIDGQLGRKDERIAKAGRAGPYIVGAASTITIDKIAAADISLRRSSAASHASKSTELLKKALCKYLRSCLLASCRTG